MNQRGVTMTELIVYIVLLAIISVIVGKQFNSMMKNYSDNKTISRQQSDSRDICALLAREIRNTGFKTYLYNDGATLKQKTDSTTILDAATDGSSFAHGNSSPGDTLRLMKVRLNSAGVRETGIDDIRYYLSGTNLVRNDGATIVTIAENVFGLQFQYGISATDVVVVDQSPITLANWLISNSSGTAPVKSALGSDMAITFPAAATGQLRYVQPFGGAVKQRLQVKIRIAPQTGFPDNLDTCRFSFKTASGTVLGSEPFKPYDADIVMRIPVQSGSAILPTIDYKAKGGGTLLIKSVDIVQTDLGAYTWSNNPPMNQKRYVRAIRMFVLTRSVDKASAQASSTITLADATITRPAGYIWRVFTETVEVPNNGVN